MTSAAASPALTRRIAVVGLGYVGLPVAVAFAKRFETVGFDVNEGKVARLRGGHDVTGSVQDADLVSSGLRVTSDVEDLLSSDFFIVAVPTPIDEHRRPDLGALRSASESVGRVLKRGDIVVYESTVYPGVTEEVCGPILERVSGLVRGRDFKLAYSPERINPGDPQHDFADIIKVVSAEDAESLDIVTECYTAVVTAGVHRASSIKVAEAAKVIENTQRDLNIALMNELALIFDRIGIDTNDVLDAAATKWNFVKFTPGLVGGHCIGVDPYYLTSKAEQLGIHPQVILAGRRINDGMGTFVAQQTIKELGLAGRNIKGARVAVLGISFKENVPDARNSRVPTIVEELTSFGATILVHDPVVDPADAREEYGIALVEEATLERLDAIVLAVSHAGFAELVARLLAGSDVGVVVDVKAALDPATIPAATRLWRL